MRGALQNAAGRRSTSTDFHLSHERLEVYHVELTFVAWVTELLEEAGQSPARRLREVTDQLDRASLSILLNTAEANGKRQRPVRARFFDDARGSATESAACLDALVAKKAVPKARVVKGKRMLAQVIAMLSRLIDLFEAPQKLREEEIPYLAAGGEVLHQVVLNKENEEEKEKD